MSSNLLMQVPIAPLSPPLSPGSNLFKNSKSSLVSMSNPKNEKSNEKSHDEQQGQQNATEVPLKPKNKYRMRLCDAPPELLELIKRSEKSKEKKSLPINNSSTFSTLPNSVLKTVSSSLSSSTSLSSSSSSLSQSSSSLSSSSITSNDQNYHKIISTDERRHRFRKNPYPKKAPSKSSPGITLQVDVYTPLKEDPKALLRRNHPLNNSTSTSITSSTSSLFTDSSSGTDSSPPASPILQRPSPKKQLTKTKTRTKRTKPTISERKRKGNSLARVMADRGLLESTLSPMVTVGEIKPIRIPPPPPMQFDELMRNIEELNLDLTVLHRANPKISWKGQPLSISHLPHYASLHSKEAQVASTLRLTPVQYLTAKYTLISSARRYVQKSLPFRKSDAQKLLRIDVNKASKLWEFFMQVKWI